MNARVTDIVICVFHALVTLLRCGSEQRLFAVIKPSTNKGTSRREKVRNNLRPTRVRTGTFIVSFPCEPTFGLLACPRTAPAGKMTRASCQCGNSYLETRAILILGAGNRLRYARCHFPPRRIPNESRCLSANSFALFAMRTDVRTL